MKKYSILEFSIKWYYILMTRFQHKGIWKFSDDVSFEKIQTMAEKWKNDFNYKSIEIRKISPKGYGLEIVYQNPNGFSLVAFQKYIQTTQEYLKVMFGDKIIGYDISNMHFKIK